ncbi:hypothetical protein GDO78_021962 [Eleutherodactylus coqui]|uniref:Oxysterol-binding protein n=1 Tax=Eleutherodactylus coqui TaxID=57060 RepID=A0A8J6EGV1_ELECQ|nr:hypothetical protein GDO78_021962 [Eleutherodactylus coqui]
MQKHGHHSWIAEVQKKNYRQEKKRATKQLFSALKDPSVVIVADWLKYKRRFESSRGELTVPLINTALGWSLTYRGAKNYFLLPSPWMPSWIMSTIPQKAAVEDNPYCRMKQVLKWYLSGFYKKPKGIKKPYNSILGEKFRCCWFHPQTNSHTFYIAEQVSHHPPVSAFHVSNRKDGFCITGSILARSRFYGNSLSAILDGKARLTFMTRDEDYIITMPYAHCKGLLYGTMTMELGGKISIECEKTRYTTELEFKLKPFFGGSDTLNQICGKIKTGSEVLANLDGHWDREVYLDDVHTGSRDIFWNPTAEIRRQRLKRHIVLFEEQTEMESERLWQHVTSAISDGNQRQATDEKYIIEDAQRKAAKERKDNNEEWVPQLFTYDEILAEWRYKYEDDVRRTCAVAAPFISKGLTHIPERLLLSYLQRPVKGRCNHKVRPPTDQQLKTCNYGTTPLKMYTPRRRIAALRMRPKMRRLVLWSCLPAHVQ